MLLPAIMCCAAGAALAQTPTPVRQGFHLEVPISPAPVQVGDRLQLVYELHLTNFASSPLALLRVQVLNAATGAVLGDFRQTSLAPLIGRPGLTSEEADRRIVAPGMRAVVYLEVPVDEVPLPSALRHRVEFDVSGTEGRERVSVEGGATDIDDRPLPKLGPPLRGGPWVAVYEPAMERGHRRVIYAVDGQARIPGRFAIDWMKVDVQGAFAGGTGSEVLAVADAVVAAARDNFEPATAGAHPTLSDETGNYIVLDLGDGRYAFYEHLQAGLRVSAGDRVRRGQVIAALGATGHVTRPHLHFHVGNAPVPLTDEGLPYLLDDVHVLGGYPSIDAFRRGEQWIPRATGDRAPANPFFPAPNAIVRFPDG